MNIPRYFLLKPQGYAEEEITIILVLGFGFLIKLCDTDADFHSGMLLEKELARSEV